ncbi:MAG: 7-cyano-7-deazaguanine synthase, partial [Elusimicrobiales bacterium]
KAGEIPSTYVPARNTVFISLALALAETIDAEAIYIGVNSIDFSGYPDCRPVYVKKYQKLIDVATKKTTEGKKIVLKTPLLHMSKVDIIKKGISLGLDLSLTWSCYKSGKKPCGRCPSCIIRKEAFSKVQTYSVPDRLLRKARAQGG